MEPLTRWESFVNWLWSLIAWRQCSGVRKVSPRQYNYCQRHRWHLGACVDTEGVRWQQSSQRSGQE